MKPDSSFELLEDSFSKRLWAYDASCFEIYPHAIALPKTVDDVCRLVHYAKERNLPITSRGGGTGTTGGALGHGLIIDLSKNMRSILDFDEKTGIVTIEAGATLEDINLFLSPFSRMIGADVSTSDRATIGGMIASNAAGAHSRSWGSTKEQIEELEIVLSDGKARWLSFTTNETGNPLIQSLFSIRNEYKDVILKESIEIQRNAFHLPMKELLYPSGIHVAKLISGSQGTLGIITKAKLKTVPLTQIQECVLLSFSSIMAALSATKELVRRNFYGIELLDKMVVQAAQKNHNIFRSDSTAFVLLESLTEVLPSLISELQSIHGVVHTQTLSDQVYKDALAIRREGLSNLLYSHDGKTAAGFIEDLICPIEVLDPFYQSVFKILEKYNCIYAVYGHMGSGCLHIRPFLTIKNEPAQDRTLIKKILEEVAPIVSQYHGSISSEHGSGIIRSWLTPSVFSNQYIAALQEVKRAFDPENIMNPGKLFPPYENFSSLFINSTKSNFSYQLSNTFFRSYKAGGLERSLDSCTNNGRCRKGTGLMCPPFQITRDERDSTRGRAHALLEHVEYRHSEKEAFDRILSSCIQCKGCIQECPSHINISKMKSEELWRERKEGYWSLRSWVIAHIPTLLRKLPQSVFVLIQRISEKSYLQKWAQKWLSLSPDAFESMKLHTFKPPINIKDPSKGSVILFIDSFSCFFRPQLIQKALHILEQLGETPILYQQGCCGRALFSKGYLDEAEKEVSKVIHDIGRHQESLPIIFLEPSCWSSVHDEWQDLPSVSSNLSKNIAKRSLLIEDFLLTRLDTLKALFKNKNPKQYFFHEHCHVRALQKESTSSHYFKIRALLETIPHISIIFDTESSCCGMAGSFGIEKEHTAMSQEIGTHTFFKAANKPIDGFITSGISCHSQVNRLFPNIPVFHPIEVLYKALVAENPFF